MGGDTPGLFAEKIRSVPLVARSATKLERMQRRSNAKGFARRCTRWFISLGYRASARKRYPSPCPVLAGGFLSAALTTCARSSPFAADISDGVRRRARRRRSGRRRGSRAGLTGEGCIRSPRRKVAARDEASGPPPREGEPAPAAAAGAGEFLVTSRFLGCNPRRFGGIFVWGGPADKGAGEEGRHA